MEGDRENLMADVGVSSTDCLSFLHHRLSNDGLTVFAPFTEDNPRYRFPGKRERDGTVYEFRKTLFLYNGFRLKTPVDDLIVVEGFTGVWWLVQNGLPDAVATMGADCSEKQAELIVFLVKTNGRVAEQHRFETKPVAMKKYSPCRDERIIDWPKSGLG